LREKLVAVLIIPSSWGSQLNGEKSSTPCHIKTHFWCRCRGERRLLQGEFRTHILYFVLISTLLYFYLLCFIKKHKKNSFLYSCFYLLAFSFVRMINPEVEVRTFKQQGGEIERCLVPY
jgi:prolipoprotein diacylglyceryltransferase